MTDNDGLLLPIRYYKYLEKKDAQSRKISAYKIPC